MKYKLIISAMCVSLLAVHVSQSAGYDATSPENLITRLYKEYQPDNVKKLSPKQRLNLGLHLDNPEAVSRYFDDDLVRLIRKEEDCTNKTHEICHLDFDPVLDAQDFDEETPLNLQIRPVAGKQSRYEVTFTNIKRRTLVYELKQTAKGWRISDIVYPKGTSLKKMLQKK